MQRLPAFVKTRHLALSYRGRDALPGPLEETVRRLAERLSPLSFDALAAALTEEPTTRSADR